MDRTQLFDTLSNLPPAAFERLLIAVNMPRMNRAGAAAKIGDQVSALLEWVESPIGPGVEAIAQYLTELNHFEFDAYLRSLVATYEKWWEYYTLTDAVGRVEQPAPEKPSVFDFGLMVQTIAKETDSSGSDLRSGEREKTERLPVLEGIRKYADDHVLLVGRPGSGKSTALIRLLLEEATQTLQQSEGQVPVLIELRYWNTSIEGLIQGFLQRHGLTLDVSTLSTLLGQGRFLLLIDGLNELPSEGARTQLSAFRRNHPKVPMIFTRRDLGLGGDLGIEKKLEMQPLTEAQMKDFIRAYVPDQAEVMLRQLNSRLREFGQTPLLLWMLCEVFQQSPNRQMPTNLAEVFRAFTTMYEDSSVRKHEVALLKGDVRPLSDRRLWKETLKALAVLMMQGETPVDFRVAVHRTEAERELGKIFAEEQFPVRDILDDLLKYHLLQTIDTGQLKFCHQLIQEYYAAEYLLRLLPELSDEQLRRDYLNLLKWTEPLALLLALAEEEAQVLRVVKLAMDDVDLMLGTRFAGEVKPAFQNQSIKHLDELKIHPLLKCFCLAKIHSEATIPGLLKALRHHDSHVRRAAAGALGRIGTEAAVPGLLEALEDQSPHVRRAAADALGRIGTEAAIPGLLEALEDQSPHVRRAAADALGRTGTESAVPGLLEALEDQSPHVRRAAADALGRIGAEAAIPGLLEALEDQDYYVRGTAFDVLGKIGTEVAIPRLLIALEHKDYDIRQRAADALIKIGSLAAVPGLLEILKYKDNWMRRQAILILTKLGNGAIVTDLLKVFEHKDYDVRGSAAEALVMIGNELVVSEMLKALEHKDYYVRESAATALGSIGNKTVTPGLLKALEDRHYRVRESAATALGSIGNKTVTPGLLKALEDRHYRVRKSAATALGSIGNETVIPGLLKALEDRHYRVRESAATALGSIGNETVIPGLLKALKDRYSPVGRSVAIALAKIGNEAAISGLIKYLKYQRSCFFYKIIALVLEENQNKTAISLLEFFEDWRSFVRQNAAESLGIIGKKVALPELIDTLEDQHSNVRWRAAEALGKMGCEAAIPELLKSLKSKSHISRERTVLALASIDSVSIIPGLIEALEDEISTVRLSATKALIKIGNEAAVNGLIKAVEDEDISVCRSAIEALSYIGGEAVIPELLKTLECENSTTRSRVAEALIKIGNGAVIAGLIKALQHKEYYVRETASKSLGDVGSEIAIPALLNALQDHDYRVRWGAAVALGKIGGEVAISALLLTAFTDLSLNVRRSALHVLGKIGSESLITPLWELHFQQPQVNTAETISAVQNRCKFYNYEIWQEAEANQNSKLEVQKSEQSNFSRYTINQFPNAVDVKIFERIENYHEHFPDSNS